MYIKCPIEVSATNYPDKEWCISKSNTVTYKQAHQLISAIQLDLKDYKKQKRVAILSKCKITVALYTWAALRQSLVPVILNIKEPTKTINQTVRFLNATFIDLKALAQLEPVNSLHNALHLNAVASVIATSGSSGKPRFVEHLLSHHYYSYMGIKTPLSVSSKAKWFHTLPMHHISGLAILFRMAFVSGTLVMSATDNWGLEKATHASLVCTQVQALIDTNKLSKLTGLKALLLGGSAISENVKDALVSLSINAFASYGLTESASLITLALIKDYPSVGCVLPFRELAVTNDAINIKGKTLFKGYVQNDFFTELTLDQSGWFNTHDLGCLVHKELLVKGRKDAMIISGGENVSLYEIENTLLNHPLIKACKAIGVKDDTYGEVVHMYIGIDNLLTNDLIHSFNEFLMQFLPNYKCPKQYFLMSNLPLSTGKIKEICDILPDLHKI